MQMIQVLIILKILGQILDIAELVATPALVEACVKGIEKEGKAEFKVFGKKHSLSMSKLCQFFDKKKSC